MTRNIQKAKEETPITWEDLGAGLAFLFIGIGIISLILWFGGLLHFGFLYTDKSGASILL